MSSTHEGPPPKAGTAAGWALGVLATVVAGALTGVIDPRGPVSPQGAILVIAGAAASGWAAGRLAGSRWAALVGALGFVLGFELTRSWSPLPTAGPPRFDSGFAVLAFVIGRVLMWLIACLPLALGALWGARATRPVRRRPIALTVVTTIAVVAAGSLFIPPAPPPVETADGAPAPGGFAEVVEVELGGHRQWLEIRGIDRSNPVLLYLAGGPGQSDLAFSRVLLEPITADFTIVGWDQRGAGKSYPDLDPGTLTLQRAVDDTVELAHLLSERFGQERIYLLGESWGTLLGVLAVHADPGVFAAYIGSGQMVNPRETDRLIRNDLIAAATERGDQELRAQLDALGEPPYGDVFAYGKIMASYGLLEGAYTRPTKYYERVEAGGVGPLGIFGGEYGPLDRLNVARGLIDMFAVMYPQLHQLDLSNQAAALQVPVFIISGDHELSARSDLAKAWFRPLAAPAKRWYQFADAGHAAAFERADDLHRILVTDVLGAGR